MALKLFLDTNVFIDALAHREPFQQNAKLILALGILGEFELWMSATQATDVFYVLSEGGKANRTPWAKEQLKKLCQFVHACDFTSEDINEALKSTWRDFEDACLNQGIHKVNPDVVVTGNLRDFALSDYPVVDCNGLFDWVEAKTGIAYCEIAFSET